MPANDMAKIFITAVSALCGALWGYAIPSYLSEDWRWRILALPAGALCAAVVWWRYGARPVVAPFAEMDVSVTERVVVTVAAVLMGACGGVFIPLGLTRSFPKWTVAVPLGMLLAIIFGALAWRNPAMFFKNRRF